MEQTMNKIPETIRNGLRVVPRGKILELRLTGKEFIIFKFGEKFYAYRPKSEEETKTIEEAFEGCHKCGDCANFYKNGKLCPKVADCSVETEKKFESDYIEALKASKRLEKYPIILQGAEYFNSQKEFLIVKECSNFKPNTQERVDREENSKKAADAFFEEKARQYFAQKHFTSYGTYPTKLN